MKSEPGDKEAGATDMTTKETMSRTDSEDTTDQEPSKDATKTSPKGDTSKDEGRLAALGRSGRGLGTQAVSVRAIIVAIVILGLVAAVIATSWMLVDKGNEVDAMKDTAAGEAHAERVATDYAVGAAAMDYTKTAEWKERLTKGTSPELTNRLTQAATSMEQITAPLQWTSTSNPISANVRSTKDGTYVVDCFVDVMTKNSQAPEGIQSTATYSVTIDSRDGWVITDVGGIGAMVGQK